MAPSSQGLEPPRKPGRFISLHWVLDIVFRDDECRVRTAHASANFTAIKHMALNLLRRAKDKLSIRARRKAAAWNDDFLAGLVTL